MFGKFDAPSILHNYQSETPVVHFTGIQLFRQNIDPAKLGMAVDKYGLPIQPVFTSSQNSITFSFTGIVPTEQQIVYQYKLDGFDKEWQSTDELAEASYTNLPPGNYIFYAKAANINGVWSKPIGFGFQISQPWYFTTWAFVLWVLIFILIILLLYRLAKRSLKKKEHIERLVLEEKLKVLRAQINPHFLQNTFSFLLQSLKKQPIDYIESFIDRLSSYLRNVLDRSDETVVTLENELDFAEEYLTINQLIFPNSFQFSFNVSETVDTYSIILPSLLLQPLLENAIKHSISHVEKSMSYIDVSIRTENGYVRCIVGNSSSPQHTLNNNNKAGYKPKGLAITEQRLTLLFKNKKKPTSILASHTAERYEVSINIPL